jgi:hypothetical protein
MLISECPSESTMNETGSVGGLCGNDSSKCALSILSTEISMGFIPGRLKKSSLQG